MNRTAAILMLLALSIGFVAASPAFARIRPGIEAGVNVSTIDYFHENPFVDWNNGWRPSFTGGAVVEFPLGGRFALTTGLRYVQQGNKVEFTVTIPPPVEGEFRIMQNYLAIPVLVEFRPIATSGFFLLLGPEVGFLLSGRLKLAQTVHYLGVPTHIEESMNLEGYLEDVNISIDGGAGLAFPLWGHGGVVQLRYSHGVSSAAKEEDHWVTDWSTQGIEFLAGMRW